MKNINKFPDNRIAIYIISIFGLTVAFINSSFLSGKIIDIPLGTREGGIIAAIGVAAIMIVVALVFFGAFLLINRRRKDNTR